jgi:hypothetical protein
MSNIKQATDALHKAFNYLNRDFFNNELPPVALTIQSKGKRMAYGWYTLYTAWEDKKKNIQMNEINLSAEFLNLPYNDMMDTILHEMVHHYCFTNKKKDTSRGGTFHNKTFKLESENHGFYYDAPADKKYGWTFSKLKPETIEIISKYDIDRSAFSIARIQLAAKESKKPKSFKWVCPECQDTIRSTKEDVIVICGKHFKRTKFILENGEGEENESE